MDEAKAQSDITQYLIDQGYTENKVSLEKDSVGTNISIVTDMQSDEKVAGLSQSIQQFLIESKFISGADQIIQQSIT